MFKNLFAKRERTAIFIFVVIVLVFLAVPYIYDYITKPTNPGFSNHPTNIESTTIDSNVNKSNSAPNTINRLFEFDPNTASQLDLHQLGFSDRSILSIENYRKKGGRFRTPEDLYKIWYTNKEHIAKLIPYVTISGGVKKSQITEYSDSKFDPENANNSYSNNENSTPNIKSNDISSSYQPYQNKPIQIEVNQADSVLFETLYGIGPALASRIVKYRNNLGGFVDINQIREVYGVKDSVFNKFSTKLTINTSDIQRININTATLDQLKTHPYIKYTLAKVTIAYREMHGKFKNINDLQKVHLYTPETIEKLTPYLNFD